MDLNGYITAMDIVAKVGDPEAEHKFGEIVLVEVIRALAVELGATEQANILIEKWEKLPKWYS